MRGLIIMANNLLIDVQTWQPASTARMINTCALIYLANKKFNNFEDFKGNRGSTVTFDLPLKFNSEESLAITTWQPTVQRQQALTVDREKSVACEFSNPETIYNVADYMERVGEAAAIELGSVIEADVGQTIIEHTYRAYGDGVTSISSFQQLAEAAAKFRNTGAPKSELCGIIPDTISPAIVGSGLNQFAPIRNNEIANSWQIGNFSNVDWYTSNLLPIHTAGTVGDAQKTLVVVGINPAGTQLSMTITGDTGADADAIKKNDILTFKPTSGLRYLTEYGHHPSMQAVQVRAVSDAAAVAGTPSTIVVNIFPALIVDPTDALRNINKAVTAGMELTVAKSHVAGMLFHKSSLMLAMAKLPNQSPFPTSNAVDKNTGAAMRLYHGTKFAENLTGFVHDALIGYTLIDANAQRLIIPLS
jgi:P22 coat protein - gene protein 5